MKQDRKSDEPLRAFGAALASVREAAGISKRQMEMTANISRPQIGSIEAGRIAPSARTLIAYLEVCGIDLAKLLLGGPGSVSTATPVGKVGRPSTKVKANVPALDWEDDDDGSQSSFEMIGKEYPVRWNYRIQNGHWECGNKHKPDYAAGIGVDDLHAKELLDDWRRENLGKHYG